MSRAPRAGGFDCISARLAMRHHNNQGRSRKGEQEITGKKFISAFLLGTNAKLFCFLH
jgi:hypothetical protein